MSDKKEQNVSEGQDEPQIRPGSVAQNLGVITIIVAPIIFSIVAFPDSFNLSWNEGRGGLLFAMAFILAELVGLKFRVKRRRILILIGLSGLTILYFVALPLGLRGFIIESAPYYKVLLINSWIWMWDFLTTFFYVFSALVIILGRKGYKIAPAGIIYLLGSAVILYLDAFFPYDSLGPLQFIVPVYLKIDEEAIKFIDNNIINIGSGVPAVAHGNLLLLNGLHGPFGLKVYWPSAGVHSSIIYTFVMLAFLLKLDIPLGRKAVYFFIGTLGTGFVNVIRITSLSLFALIVTTNVKEWEAFHSVAGEIMFLPWLGIYLIAVICVEGIVVRTLLPPHIPGTGSRAGIPLKNMIKMGRDKLDRLIRRE